MNMMDTIDLLADENIRLRSELAEVTAQRDALAEALGELLDSVPYSDHYRIVADNARKLLAPCEAATKPGEPPCSS
jgi:hypothetical protein